MKRFMLVLAILLVVGTSNLFAQDAASDITVTVEQALEVSALSGDWGVVSPGETYVITASGFKSPFGPGESIGEQFDPPGFEIVGTAGAEVLCTLVFPPGLMLDGGSAILPLASWTFGWNYDLDPTAPFQDAGPVVGNAVTVPLGPDGTGLFLGATLTVPTTAFPEEYIGEVIGNFIYTGN